MKQKAIYIIGGGKLGINTINWAKEIGLITIVTDKFSISPGLKIADVAINIDALDTNEHLKHVKDLSLKFEIVGVYCQIEPALMTCFEIRKYLKIPDNSLDSLKTSLNKDMMKKCWAKADSINTPKHQDIHSLKELLEFLKFNNGNFIIKPTKGSGSRGVQLISNKSDINSAYKLCMDSVEGEGHIIIEEYLDGRSIDANGILIKGKFYPCGILEKYQIGSPTFLPLGGNEIIDMPKEEETQIYELLEKSAAAIGFSEGPIKADLIKCNKKYYMLEVAARLHGDITTCNILPYGSGINPIKFYFNYLYSGVPNDEHLSPKNRDYAIWRAICLPPGVCNKITYPSKNKHKNITKVWLNNIKHNKIHKYDDTSKVPGYICSYGSTKLEAEKALEKYFKDFISDIDINPYSIEWYELLGKHLDNIGFSRLSCGYQIENKFK